MNPAPPDIIANIIRIIVNPAIYLLFALAVLYFMYGMLQFIRNAAESKERAQGARAMLFGVIGLAIMISSFALVNFIIRFVGAPADQRPTYSQFQ